MSTVPVVPLRYVVLRHETPAGAPRGLHWDFMIERGDVLRTWALSTEPSSTVVPNPAQALPDHRRAYLEYEGPISGDRGHVTRWDFGFYSVLAEQADAIVLELSGHRLVGRVELVRREPATDHWTFRFSSGRAATSA